ncbi:hypothetical protein L596_016595 [Steinernema carpocapsae]|uniref:C2H2-type domain-containing protein n=1 Tax=Steinernema carpocapsae TaxID=34508 RepID=A0A4U5NJ69_STECR|nr:hypothetical protein L596_016595 [Steinernema carpocapsae]
MSGRMDLDAIVVCEDCGSSMKQKSLPKHKSRFHPQKPTKGTLPCPHNGCTLGFRTLRDVCSHMNDEHGFEFEFEKYEFDNASDFQVFWAPILRLILDSQISGLVPRTRRKRGPFQPQTRHLHGS